MKDLVTLIVKDLTVLHGNCTDSYLDHFKIVRSGWESSLE